MLQEVHDRGQSSFNFWYGLQFSSLVRHIFLPERKKIEVIFNREDYGLLSCVEMQDPPTWETKIHKGWNPLAPQTSSKDVFE